VNEQNEQPLSLSPIVKEIQHAVTALRAQTKQEEALEQPDDRQLRELRRAIRTLDGVSEIVTALCLPEEGARSLYYFDR